LYGDLENKHFEQYENFVRERCDCHRWFLPGT